MKLIIFDAEGVIIDTESVWDDEAKIFLGRRGIAYDREQLKHHLTGRSVQESAKVLKEMFSLKGDFFELAKERIKIMKDLLGKELGFIPGFTDFYDSVKDRYKVCVATAMDKELLEIADRKLDLFSMFNGNIFSVADVNGIGKPEPDLFLYAAQKMGVDGEDCLVIEDAPNGIEAARRAGIRCMAITTTYPREMLLKADSVVEDFNEIELI